MVASIVRHLRQHGLAVLPITAEVQAKKRFGLIQEFSRSPDVCAIVASLNCLNRGFTITAANHVILVDLEYSPEATEQAEDRVHRPGQTKPVYIHYLLSRDTIDQVMHEILVQKAQAIRHAIDGKARFEDVAEILKKVTGDVQLKPRRPPSWSSRCCLPAVGCALVDPHSEQVLSVLTPASVPIEMAGDEPFAFRQESVGRRSSVQLSLFGSML